MKIQVKKLTEDEKAKMKIPAAPVGRNGWSVWTCDPSTFDWHYDSEEEAYVYQGHVKVATADGETEIKAGDFVTFPLGLSCSWQVLEKVVKVYRFN